MSIPALDADGLLPLGDWPGGPQTLNDGEADYDVETRLGITATPDDVASRFLATYGTSSTRAILHGEWVQLRETAMKNLQNVSFLMAGGFVTDATDPDDMYLVLVADRDEFSNLTLEHQWMLRRVFDGVTQYLSGDQLEVDTDLVLKSPVGHPRYDEGIAGIVEARYMCLHPNGDDVQAGHLVINDTRGGDDDPFQELLGDPA